MKQIMIVDDEIAARTLIGITLERDGFTVIRAKNASEALQLVGEKKPDLIILDVMMPGMSGIELCSIIRSRPEAASIPILMLSARSDMETIVRGMDAGANDYLPKPIYNHDLTAKVRSMLSLDATAVP